MKKPLILQSDFGMADGAVSVVNPGWVLPEEALLPKRKQNSIL